MMQFAFLITCIQNRLRDYPGATFSDCMGRDSNQNRVYFVTFGSPPSGLNKGNTPSRTWAVLKILRKAMRTTGYHQDGGWPYALRVCLITPPSLQCMLPPRHLHYSACYRHATFIAVHAIATPPSLQLVHAIATPP